MTKFIHDQKGSITVYTMFSLVALTLSLGLGIDIARVAYEKQTTQTIVDFAARTNAQYVSNGLANVTTHVNNYLVLNKQQPSDYTVSIPSAGQLKVESHKPFKLYFLGLIGLNTFSVNQVAIATGSNIVKGSTIMSFGLIVDYGNSLNSSVLPRNTIIPPGRVFPTIWYKDADTITKKTTNFNGFYGYGYIPVADAYGNSWPGSTGTAFQNMTDAFGTYSIVKVGQIIDVNQETPKTLSNGPSATCKNNDPSYIDCIAIFGSLGTVPKPAILTSSLARYTICPNAVYDSIPVGCPRKIAMPLYYPYEFKATNGTLSPYYSSDAIITKLIIIGFAHGLLLNNTISGNDYHINQFSKTDDGVTGFTSGKLYIQTTGTLFMDGSLQSFRAPNGVTYPIMGETPVKLIK